MKNKTEKINNLSNYYTSTLMIIEDLEEVVERLSSSIEFINNEIPHREEFNHDIYMDILKQIMIRHSV